MCDKFFFPIIIILILNLISQIGAAKDKIYSCDEDQEISKKYQAVAELTMSCLMKNQKLLTVNENLNSALLKYLYRSEVIAVTSITSSKLFAVESYANALQNKQMYCEQHYYRFLWKSISFLISGYSTSKFKDTLEKLKKSPWWNSYGVFLFVEDDNTFTRCSNAYNFLSLAWDYNILSAIFLCQEKDDSLSLYTYDPYGNSIPAQWVNVREIKSRNDYPWRLLKWEKYEGIFSGCENIFFNKIKSLNGYPILTNALNLIPFLYFSNNKESNKKIFKGEDGMIMETVWKFLNATIVTVPLGKNGQTIGWVDDNGTIHGNLIDISSGKVDIGMNSLVSGPLWKSTATYPHTTLSICYVTKARGTLPWLIGLMFVFDKWTMICGMTTFFVSAIIFGYIDKRRYFSGLMNALRVFLSSSYFNPSSSFGFRILLCFVSIFPIIFYSTYQGKILFLLRNPFHLSDFKTLQDLNDSGLTIKSIPALKTLISFEKINAPHIENNSDNCISRLYKNEPVACFDYCFTLWVKNLNKKKLHVSDQLTSQYQSRFIARPDFPILDTFNKILQRLVEAGLTEFYRQQSFLSTMTTAEIYEKESNDETVKVITLKNFYYIFCGLAIGWLCGIVAFFGELIFKRILNRQKLIREQRRAYKKLKISSLLNFGKNLR